MKKQDLSQLARLGLSSAGVRRGEVLVLAVSGGPDSMALLEVMRKLAPSVGWRLQIVHVNHGLRPASKREAKLVQAYCAKYKLACSVETLRWPARLRQAKTRVEETARELRYQVLRKMISQLGARWIVTAHNADDQVETVVFNFLRGSGVRGLGGMRTVSGDVIRPWLTVPKTALLKYVKQHRVPFAVDETNLQPRFTRNRIRHQLLPILRSYNPKVDEILLQNSGLFQQADWVLRDLARQYMNLIGTVKSDKVNISISRLRELVPLMQMEVVKVAIEKVAGPAYNWRGSHFQEVMKLLAGPGTQGEKRLPGKLLVARSRDTITISRG
ncbi:MAG: tRNA(Ile)-lysidine synthetase, tRNA(Ile)-lysidine synthase [candidate division Kazan bacterium GW2011_GWA1_50_15]|uniref:tRNA(Ile)-lysidine synthase n=2 Tax=Bacteria division Kazan-3B-28 TaxID=1798534 RepID=A0A0G2A432_UNCK3|nr:MAG: tRNA(Ile)-lysidine synthetase, tRNA(Ile)-lysidine synthase [candidate division Kazan bacterium GW2011_GWA1_50_15]KKW25684.1 MAG: tRNA(Ile)-lysidine synthase [candidate division Kazan bacterium GW2011_GWC1_52_13]KKW26989.1 MAG: tRNA(Ile)-lysidine synthase [candidate division Kazan bacterium GW2011_GWB1_52_7]HAV66023.1 tRNA lysidine(34) synthetase TilS [Patescibacteria group bacterium]HCR42592.1 tRNA lysidine(34) synthetase TilS [Patescibacteria group bacterium]